MKQIHNTGYLFDKINISPCFCFYDGMNEIIPNLIHSKEIKINSKLSQNEIEKILSFKSIQKFNFNSGEVKNYLFYGYLFYFLSLKLLS